MDDRRKHNPHLNSWRPNYAETSSSNTRTNHFNLGNNANANYNPYKVSLRTFRPNRFENNPNGESGGWREGENRVHAEPLKYNHETRRKKKRCYIMGFKDLLELSKKESSDMIIMELNANTDAFETLLDSELDQDWIVLIIKILSKAFSSSLVENKNTIMNIMLKQKFMTTLEIYVLTVQYENPENRSRHKYFWNNVEEFYFNLAIMCDFSIDAVPTKACEVLSILLKIVNVSIPTFEKEQKMHLSNSTKDKFKNLIVKLELYKEKLEQKTCDEIFSPGPNLFRKNTIKGGSCDVEQNHHILGIDHHLYFIHHTNLEIQSGDESKANLHEAKYLINLARYLIQNGYKPEDIVILTAYSGQMFTLREERKKFALLLQDVRICVLDNYHDKESKIILLSLVRNNDDGKIGNFKMENRVCVALSRAKEGLYMMGNMELLCNNSEVWPKIKEMLVDQDSLGPSLPVRCQIHPYRVTFLVKPQDFDKVPEGGCNQICGSLLNCGHYCSRLCHILDRDHSTTKCKAPCLKILCELGHVCPKLCYQECGNFDKCGSSKVSRILVCGHKHIFNCHLEPKDFKCPTLVTATLPCGHETTKKPCHYNVNEWRCSVPCDSRVEPCGHSCSRPCHIKHDPDHIQYKCYKSCGKVLQGCSTETHKCPKLCHQECPPCEVVVKKKLANCNHMQNVPCNAGVDKIVCIEPCKRMILTCGHQCKRKCHQPCGGCVAMVEKTIQSCGHQVQMRCKELADIKNCHAACTKILPCGHLCKKKCNEVCTTLCRELADHTKPVFCGHEFKIECHLKTKDLPNYSRTLLQFCREPCTVVLDCEHKCGGTCGECAQGRIHKTCMEKCGVPLICGHECRIPCRTVCQPCKLKCGLKCTHSKCTKLCGDECTKCNENCARRCKHVKCTSKCWEMCTVPPCQEPCEKKLPCSHPCVGFCGDPCPPLCRICNAEELTEIFWSFEDEIDARFVLLDECKHVIESQEMEILCENDGGGANAITYMRCPKCKTPITSTQRYSDYVKQATKDVAAIKRKSCGSPKEIEEKRKELQEQLHDITLLREGRVFSTSQGFHKFVTDCGFLLQAVNKNRRQRFDLMIGKTLEVKLAIVQDIGNILEAKKMNVPKSSAPIILSTHHLQIFSEAATHLEYLLKRLTDQVERITNQEIQDFKREQARMRRIAQFVHIAESTPESAERLKIRELIYRPIIYTENYDEMVKVELKALANKANESRCRYWINRIMSQWSQFRHW